MTPLILFYYASVLAVGGTGAWVLRRHAGSSIAWIRWILVLFPLVLAMAFVLKPEGPSFWLRWIAASGLRDRVIPLSILGLVSLRGTYRIVEVIVGWARLCHQSIPGDALAEAPWLGLEALCARAGFPVPEIRFHRALRTPVVVGLRFPRLLFPARQVPGACRDTDPFWEGIEEPEEDHALIRAMLVHELEHVRHRDPWVLALVVLGGIVLPWEWVDGRSMPGRSRGPLGWVSFLVRRIGAPYRLGIQATRRIQETLADAAVIDHLEDGGRVLERVRGPTPAALPCGWPAKGIPWRAVCFLILAGAILGVAPGSAAIRYAWKGKMFQLLDLPPTWSLTLEPGFGKAFAGLLPGENGQPGKILVHIEDLAPGHLPQLIGAGFFDLSGFPKAGWVDMSWDIQMDGPPSDQGKVVLLFAAWRMELDTRQDAVTFEADADQPPEHLGGNTYRFHRQIALGDVHSGAYWLYLRYYFLREGSWTFHPPVIDVIAPDGTRRPFPYA